MYIGQIVGFANLVVGIGIGFAAWQMYEKNQRKLAKWPRKLGVVTGFNRRSVDGKGIPGVGAATCGHAESFRFVVEDCRGRAKSRFPIFSCDVVRGRCGPFFHGGYPASRRRFFFGIRVVASCSLFQAAPQRSLGNSHFSGRAVRHFSRGCSHCLFLLLA